MLGLLGDLFLVFGLGLLAVHKHVKIPEMSGYPNFECFFHKVMDNLDAPRIDDRNRTSTILAPRNCSSLWVKYDDLTFECLVMLIAVVKVHLIMTCPTKNS